MRTIHLLSFCCLFLLFLTGCWDLKELSDRALWVATGWDLTEDGQIEISAQIIIPIQIEAQGDVQTEQDFFIVTEKGENVGKVLRKIHGKLSREAFYGHRKIAFFGEEFARAGLKEKIDYMSRTPTHGLRGDVFVVKGGTAKEAISQQNPLEDPPSIAALKAHREAGGRGDTAYLHFLIAANRDGIRPTLPVIEIADRIEEAEGKFEERENAPILRITGLSVFDDQLKLKGFLNTEENQLFLWIMDILKEFNISLYFEDQHNLAVNLLNLNSRIIPDINDLEHPRFTLKLKGNGIMEENNSNFDPSKEEDLKYIEEELQRKLTEKMEQLIHKVQREYRMDIFGFGEEVHRKHPYVWKDLKGDWHETFQKTVVEVESKINVRQIGRDGPSSLFQKGPKDS